MVGFKPDMMTDQHDLLQWRIHDFLEGVRQLPKVLLFFNFFAENCMKMKEFGPGGGSPLGSANVLS